MGADEQKDKPGLPVPRDAAHAVASRARAGLLANLSHELRTPMDAILGYVELLAETPLSDTQQAYAAAIQNSAQGLLDIMNDVLNLARLDAGKLVIHSQPFSVRDCIDSVAQMLAPSAYAKHLDFIRLVDPDVPVNLVGDPLRIRQVLVNLISNAIKFTGEGQVRVRVSAHPYDGERFELVLRISDTGVGLSPADIERLFEPFSRPAAPQNDVGGTGLGLVITRSLCEAMGGSVAVHSTPGAGSTFCARLPLRSAEDPFGGSETCSLLADRAVVVVAADTELANAIARSLQSEGASTHIVSGPCALHSSITAHDASVLVVSAADAAAPAALAADWQPLRGGLPVLCLVSSGSVHKLKELGERFGGECLPAHSSMQSLSRRLATMLQDHVPDASETTGARPLAGLRLLVAEDNQFGRDYLKMLLTRHGASVDVCADGHTACRMLEEGSYDLVLMDMRMPECDGAEAMQQIRRNWDGTPPIIGLTAAPDECCRALEAGMTDCLVKPVRPSVLLRYIHEHGTAPAATNRKTERSFIDAEMRDELRADLPRRGRSLQDAIAAGDLDGVLEQAHKLAGIGALCGFDHLRDTAAAIEALVRQQHPEGIGQLNQVLQQEIEQVLSALTAD